ncbi:MAG: hypothetical protein ACXWEJ_01220 [Actinomycetota bacterium]
MVGSVQGDLVKARVALGRALTALTHPVTIGRAVARVAKRLLDGALVVRSR